MEIRLITLGDMDRAQGSRHFCGIPSETRRTSRRTIDIGRVGGGTPGFCSHLLKK